MRIFFQIFIFTIVLAIASAIFKKRRVVSNRGAVVSNGLECAKIGAQILKEEGTAVDAAIAVLFCEGVTGPQSMGIGGGFLATIYDHKTKKVRTLNARESAPANSSENMFVGVKDGHITGGHATAVPSELRGYWELHQAYGKLKWSDLIEPTIKLCEKGHRVDKFLALVLELYKERIENEPTLKEIFINKNGSVYKKNELIRRPKLAETLRIIADKGVEEFYNGNLGEQFIEDVQSMGGVLSMDDLRNYKVKWNDSVESEINEKYTLYSMPLPGSGTVLSLILNILKDSWSTQEDYITITHRIIESFKHGYGLRSNLSDDAFNAQSIPLVKKALSQDFAKKLYSKIDDTKTFTDPSYYGVESPEEILDHGTSNIAVLAPNGDAITITSTINNIFGARKISRRTGIILNDEMDDFSTPNIINSYGFQPSPLNFIRPGKRPMSSMSPSIILDKNKKVRLLIGAAGGSQIITSVALTILRHLIFEHSLNNSINTPRFHHQLLPMAVQVQPGFSESTADSLRKLGHEVRPVSTPVGFSAVTGISVDKDTNEVIPVYDDRRGGSAAVYDASTGRISIRKTS